MSFVKTNWNVSFQKITFVLLRLKSYSPSVTATITEGANAIVELDRFSDENVNVFVDVAVFMAPLKHEVSI